MLADKCIPPLVVVPELPNNRSHSRGQSLKGARCLALPNGSILLTDADLLRHFEELGPKFRMSLLHAAHE